MLPTRHHASSSTRHLLSPSALVSTASLVEEKIIGKICDAIRSGEITLCGALSDVQCGQQVRKTPIQHPRVSKMLYAADSTELDNKNAGGDHGHGPQAVVAGREEGEEEPPTAFSSVSRNTKGKGVTVSWMEPLATPLLEKSPELEASLFTPADKRSTSTRLLALNEAGIETEDRRFARGGHHEDMGESGVVRESDHSCCVTSGVAEKEDEVHKTRTVQLITRMSKQTIPTSSTSNVKNTTKTSSNSAIQQSAQESQHQLRQHVKRARKILAPFYAFYDANKDGEIDFEEFRLVLQDLKVSGASRSDDPREFQKQLFDAGDLDGNGVIDFDEFVYIMLKFANRQDFSSHRRAGFLDNLHRAKAGEWFRAYFASSTTSATPPARGGAEILKRDVEGQGEERVVVESPDGTIVAGFHPGQAGDNGQDDDQDGHPCNDRDTASARSGNCCKGLGSRSNTSSCSGAAGAHGGQLQGRAQSTTASSNPSCPSDLAHLDMCEQQYRLKLRAFSTCGLGVLLTLVFSDPAVGVMAEIGSRLNMRPFYVSFILAPLASNASELVAAYHYARKKSVKSLTIALSTLEGAACMNNTFCLAIFLFLIFCRGGPLNLASRYGPEFLSILAVEVCVAAIALTREVHTMLSAVFILSLFPLSILLVWTMENMNHV
ncbi:unnamed protein product [Amoebophrya sp. A25]|nr:unnamed protein product [Amoebophrya sp. A25]|eukprot:GSA25T00003737001.1